MDLWQSFYILVKNNGSCLFEKGLGDILVRNRNYIAFTADESEIIKFLDDCDAVFLCLPTPEVGETGESDLTYYLSALDNVANGLLKRNNGTQEHYIVIVNKSTVPIGTAERTRQVLNEKGVKNYGVVSNPEFLVGGKAIEGSMKPDRVVVGANDTKDLEVMRDIYQRAFIVHPIGIAFDIYGA